LNNPKNHEDQNEHCNVMWNELDQLISIHTSSYEKICIKPSPALRDSPSVISTDALSGTGEFNSASNSTLRLAHPHALSHGVALAE
jgi:hypothetical protein